MISSAKIDASRSVLRQLADAPHDEDWRGLVLAAGTVADLLTPQVAELRDLRGALAALENAAELDATVGIAAVQVFDAGLLLGFALARTWPQAPDEIDDWPRRALRFAGLPLYPEEETP